MLEMGVSVGLIGRFSEHVNEAWSVWCRFNDVLLPLGGRDVHSGVHHVDLDLLGVFASLLGEIPIYSQESEQERESESDRVIE